VARLAHGELRLHPALVQREPPEHRMYGIRATVSGAVPGLPSSRLADGSLDAVIAIAACRTGAVHLLTANARFLALVTSEGSALFQGDVASRPPLPAYDMVGIWGCGTGNGSLLLSIHRLRLKHAP
jgi:hypothetical protein